MSREWNRELQEGRGSFLQSCLLLELLKERTSCPLPTLNLGSADENHPDGRVFPNSDGVRWLPVPSRSLPPFSVQTDAVNSPWWAPMLSGLSSCLQQYHVGERGREERDRGIYFLKCLLAGVSISQMPLAGSLRAGWLHPWNHNSLLLSRCPLSQNFTEVPQLLPPSAPSGLGGSLILPDWPCKSSVKLISLTHLRVPSVSCQDLEWYRWFVWQALLMEIPRTLIILGRGGAACRSLEVTGTWNEAGNLQFSEAETVPYCLCSPSSHRRTNFSSQEAL